jgi:hypothetical protein
MRLRESFSRAEIGFVIGVPLVWGVLLFVISAPGVVFHVSPLGPIGLALFAAALLLVMRERAPVAEEEPLVAA